MIRIMIAFMRGSLNRRSSSSRSSSSSNSSRSRSSSSGSSSEQVGSARAGVVAGQFLSKSCGTVCIVITVVAFDSVLVIVARSTCCCCDTGGTRSTLFIVTTTIVFFTAVTLTRKASAGIVTAIAGKAWAVVIFTSTGAAANTAPFVADIASTETALVGIVASFGSCSGETGVAAFVVLHFETSRKHGW